MIKTNEKDKVERTSLHELAEHWKQLERKTVEQRQLADTYYESTLMGPIIQAYIENNRDKATEPVDCLILSVGTSYEPLVLNIKLLSPRRVLFLYTEKSECYLEKIVKYCNLSAEDYEKSIVHETEPLDMYREIKRAYLKWNKPEKIFIDITGGTNYLANFRKPDPGTETLFYIDNPMEIFGDITTFWFLSRKYQAIM